MNALSTYIARPLGAAVTAALNRLSPLRNPFDERAASDFLARGADAPVDAGESPAPNLPHRIDRRFHPGAKRTDRHPQEPTPQTRTASAQDLLTHDAGSAQFTICAHLSISAGQLQQPSSHRHYSRAALDARRQKMKNVFNPTPQPHHTLEPARARRFVCGTPQTREQPCSHQKKSIMSHPRPAAL